MLRSTDEQLFDRYRRVGDLEALGEVFDRTAPGLLRIALHLVRDPGTAEDLVQATFLKAMEVAADWSPGRPVRPWLGGILRHLGQQARWREGRTPDVGRVRVPEGRDPASAVEAQELTEALDAAIAALPEPYRPVLRLHLGYGHHPAEIAHSLDRPASTVRVQLARGLALLRKKLGSGFVAALGIALLPERGLASVKGALLQAAAVEPVAAAASLTFTGSANLSSAAASVPITAGLLIMKKLLGVAAVAVVACGIWLAWPWSDGAASSSIQETNPSAETLQSDGTGDSSVEANPSRDSGQAERVAMSSLTESVPEADAGLGSLLVRARWADGSSAGDVAVTLVSFQPLYHTAARRATDAEGSVRFEGLAPGKYDVASHRGGEVPAEVVAGEVAEATLDLEGIDVKGVVVDADGGAVSNASIWLTSSRRDWQGGRIVARSGTDGKFTVRGVPPDQSLGALSRGSAPSELFDLGSVDTSKPPIEVRLVVTVRGGSVSGVVRSADGEAVAGAVVCLGAMPSRFRRRQGSRELIETWTPLVVESGTDGRFEFPSVSAGDHPLAVRAKGSPIFCEAVTVREGEVSSVDVRLREGVAVHGVVKDENGEPIAGAVVRAYDRGLDESFIQGGQFDYESVLGFAFTSADSAGRYRMADIAPGRMHLYATRQRKVNDDGTLLRAKKVVEGAAGESIEWNPVIEPGPTISGRVTYKSGTPMLCYVNLIHRESGEMQSLVADRQGRFRFTNLVPTAYLVRVQYPHGQAPKDAPPLQQDAVWPGRDEVRLVASFDRPVKQGPGIVLGRVQDAGRRRTHPGPFLVKLWTEKGESRAANTNGEGEFEIRRVPPGRCRLIVMSGEHEIRATDWLTVSAGGKHDAGTLVTEPGGAIRFRLLRNRGAEKVEPRLGAQRGKTGERRSIRPGTATVYLEENLSPGEYDILVSGQGFLRTTVKARVIAGGEVEVEVSLRHGLRRDFELFWPDEAKRLTTRIFDAAGAAVVEMSHQLRTTFPNPYKPRLFLPPGRYRIAATTENDRTAEHAFEVRAEQAVAPAMRLELRPGK